MVARFEKINAASSFDGFDAKTLYQMVPTGGSRGGLSVISDNEEIDIAFEPPRIAKFSSPRTFNPPSPHPFGDYATRLAPRTTFTFEILGEKAGNTTLVIRNRHGKALSSLLVSVKNKITKTYSLCRLHDMRRTCPWNPNELEPMMRRVAATYLKQANIELSNKTNQIFEVNINDRDLGDPLIPARILKPEKVPLASFIVRKTPSAAFSADFILYFVWDLRDIRKDIVGLTINGKICFIEFNSTDRNENALTAGHEIGHGLGLEHSGAATLMAGDGNSRSSLLQQFEIDMINRTNE